jgi:Tol biopolymer transport system component
VLRDGFNPVWSPDGRRIAFVRWASGSPPDIFTARRDGTDQRALPRPDGAHHDDQRFAPSWQPRPR